MPMGGTTEGVLRGGVGHETATLRAEKGSDRRICG